MEQENTGKSQTDPTGMPLVLRISEVAAVLRVSKAAAYEMCRDGRLGSIRVGRSLRVPRRAVERLLDAATGSVKGSGE